MNLPQGTVELRKTSIRLCLTVLIFFQPKVTAVFLCGSYSVGFYMGIG